MVAGEGTQGWCGVRGTQECGEGREAQGCGGEGGHKGSTDCGNRLFFVRGLRKNCENTVRISEIMFKADCA